MAIDLKKMRNKLDKLEGKGRTQSVFWKPQDGDQTIRILPMPDGDPFREMWFHYNLGENHGFLSPKRNFGEDDPLDAFVRKLFSDGEPNDIKMAKDLMARQRFFSPVIVRGEEDKISRALKALSSFQNISSSQSFEKKSKTTNDARYCLHQFVFTKIVYCFTITIPATFNGAAPPPAVWYN